MSNALPRNNVLLRFPPAPEVRTSGAGAGEEEEETYQLLELPAEILKQVEALKDKGEDAVFPLTIKGRPSDDATLCTPTSTFLLRTIGISNSLLVCRTPSTATTPNHDKDKGTNDGVPLRPTLQVRDVCHQILECVPVAPDLERIRGVLRDSAWEGIGESSLGKRKRAGDGGGKKGKADKRWTREQLRSIVLASEGELEKGLRERNVVEVDGRMLLLPPPQLKELLTILLSLLAIYSSTSTSGNPTASSREIIQGLDEHQVPSALATAVMELFGSVRDDEWVADPQGMVREVGRGLLCKIRGETKLDAFMEEWKSEVGGMWTDHVDIKLLEGDYLISAPPASALSSARSSPLLSYFPLYQLPSQPALRFSDLFITRPRWRPDEMAPFLKGLTRDGDTKERDKLVVKFVRVVKEKEGVWWYPRRTA